MSKKNDDFFIEKKPWSTVKDELLGCYLRPYIQKVIHTKHPILYIDCFAGKGRFEDGKHGSPLIALDIINDCTKNSKAEQATIRSEFIDLNYANELRVNLAGYSNIGITSGKYEEHIESILANKSGYNVFMYVDPYGIKALNCSLFDSFSKGRFNSIELLVNLNSFGFIREACHALGISFKIENNIFDDLIEYEATKLSKSDQSVNELNDIAGGEYWQEIIYKYRNGIIDGYKAEKTFSEMYCNRLMKSYKYVLNMPLRIKRDQHPKYRMIHATNHRDGCILMADNICSRWEALQDIQTSGQLSFFEETYDNETIDDSEICSKVIEHFSTVKKDSSLNECLADFYTKNGAICPSKKIKEILKELEKSKKIIITRTPSVLLSGNPSRFMDEKKWQQVFVRWST